MKYTLKAAAMASLLAGILISASPASAQTAETANRWRPLLNEKLSAWELWMGVPHRSVTNLPPGTPTSPNGHDGTPLGLNNDPKHVFSVRTENGEPVLHITGEIFGGLTSRETFSNYHFRAEFRWGTLKWEPKLAAPRDNGILFHCTGPHGVFWNVWKRGIEFQVEEKNMGDAYFLSGTGAEVPVKQTARGFAFDASGEVKKIGSYEDSSRRNVRHRPGDFEKPNGEWNTLELYTVGQTAVMVVNGNVDQVLRHTVKTERSDPAVVPLTAGQIQLQSEGAEAEYRRIEIQPINDFPPEIKKAAAL